MWTFHRVPCKLVNISFKPEHLIEMIFPVNVEYIRIGLGNHKYPIRVPMPIALSILDRRQNQGNKSKVQSQTDCSVGIMHLNLSAIILFLSLRALSGIPISLIV